MKFLKEFKLQRNCEINLLIKTFLGLVEMMFGLLNVSFSLLEWQAVKMTFFAPQVFSLYLRGVRLGTPVEVPKRWPGNSTVRINL